MKMYEETKPLLLEALQLREDALGTEHRLVVEVGLLSTGDYPVLTFVLIKVLHLLAHTLDCLQEITDAQRVLEQALAIYIRLNQSEFNEDVGNTYAELGKLFFHRSDFAISITYFKKGILIQVLIYEVVSTNLKMISLLALEVWMKLKGIESTEVTDAMLNLAFAYKKNDEVLESRNTYEQGN